KWRAFRQWNVQITVLCNRAQNDSKTDCLLGFSPYGEPEPAAGTQQTAGFGERLIRSGQMQDTANYHRRGEKIHAQRPMVRVAFAKLDVRIPLLGFGDHRG